LKKNEGKYTTHIAPETSSKKTEKRQAYPLDFFSFTSQEITTAAKPK